MKIIKKKTNKKKT